MGKVLRDIWILTINGIVVFNRVFDETIDSQLFGGLMSAINSFAGEISHSALTNFELSDKRFTITKRENMLFIVNSDKGAKQKKVDKELNLIADKFIELYLHRFKDFDGDISEFKAFEKEITGSLEDPIKRFERGFW